MLARANGAGGYPQLNSGTIHAPTLLLVIRRLKHCMVIHPVFWLLILRLCLTKKWQSRLLIAAGWINCSSIISTELSIE